MIVYQTSYQGYYVAEVEALSSPEEEGVYLIPGGCVVKKPPEVEEGYLAKYNWETDSWNIVEIPKHEEPKPEELKPLTLLYKTTLWSRLTEEEAATLDTVLTSQSVRLRRIYDSAQYIDQKDPNYSLLKDGIVAVLGEERAEEVLAPEH